MLNYISPRFGLEAHVFSQIRAKLGAFIPSVGLYLVIKTMLKSGMIGSIIAQI